MPVSSVAPPIAFSCTHCAMELTVPAELAGVSGPCPHCGQTILSPTPLAEPVSDIPTVEIDVVPSNESISAMPPKKLRPKPRSMKSRAQNPALVEPVGPLMDPSAVPRGPRGVAQRNQVRAVHPVVGLSSKYEDRQEAGSIIRVAIAVLLTLGVVIAVTMFMTSQ